MVLLAIYLVYPAVVTVIGSFQDKDGAFTLANWASLATPPFLEILRNNILWLLIATSGSVGLGLLTAALFDRIRRESLAKVFIFMPLAISLVGATVIWKFVYAWQPPSQPQFGLLNADLDGIRRSADPVGHAVPDQPPVGDGDPDLAPDGLRHGRVLGGDQGRVGGGHRGGAGSTAPSERQMFFKVIVPLIRGSIVTVTTTIAIATLKIFDIVMSISGGRNHDDVVAVRMFAEMFQFFNDGRAAALATVLFIAVLPVMILNLRNFRRQAAM